MKIDRLIGILSILLQKEITTAPELAEHFEVSRRTINRDIETLCQAGIPIQTIQGVGGGISIMDGYRMDRTLLTSRDMQMILAGLRSLDSVSGSGYYGQLMEKIQAGSSEFISGRDSILIDLSSWYKDTLAPKIALIQDAIELQKRVGFDYYSPSGDSKREIEPYYLVFKWSSWYVYGYCLLRKEFRLFKLNRMDDIHHGKSFERRSKIPEPELDNSRIFPEKGRVKAVFDSSMKWQLVEEYGVNSFVEKPDGTLLFEHEYPDDEGLISWLLSCRDKVTVLEPESVREKLQQITSDILRKYKEVEKRHYGGINTMAFDYKKEYKEFYMPKGTPSIVTIPKMNYIAVRGHGDPNEEGGEYKQAIGLLYAIAFTIKMSKKGSHQIDGYFDYVVPPLEGFWWQDGVEGIDYARKADFNWISVIRLPDFVTKADFDWAIAEAKAKKKTDFSKVEFFTYDEGVCVQCMHIGSYDDEPATVEKMHKFMTEQGYVLDITEKRLHHEIYLSDARKVAPEKLKTVIRHPVRKC